MMKFTDLVARAAYLDEDNIDTDAIFPARFLLLLERETLGRCLFHDRRFDKDGNEITDFILNQQAFRNAAILISGKNFGCGSSREHAVWTLLGHGIRVVIAQSFGEIFQANCFKNGLLPIQLKEVECLALANAAQQLHDIQIDLRNCIIRTPSHTFAFTIGEAEREALLNGWDEVTLILQKHTSDIRNFEAHHRKMQPWLFDDAGNIVTRSQPKQLSDNSDNKEKIWQIPF